MPCVRAGFDETQAGSRPFVLQREDNALVIGTNTVKIITSGQAQLRGSLTDGRKFSMATSLAQNGDCPFYVSLRPGSEAIFGWLNFPTNTTSSFGSNLFWVKSGTNGFRFQVDAIPVQP